MTGDGPCYAAVQVTTGIAGIPTVKGACGRPTTNHTRQPEEVGCPECQVALAPKESR